MAQHTQLFGRREFLMAISVAAVGMSAASGVFACTPSDKIVRIGVVSGNFGSTFQWHLDPNRKVTAVCDLREDRLEHMVRVYGAAAKHKDFRQSLQHPRLDGAAVFTPAPLHVWMATKVMKAGKHVISAVPAGMSACSNVAG
jgi:hypothetical protein